MPSHDAVIVDAIRTPIGRRGGALAGVHAVDLAATAIRGLVERTGIDPALIDDVIWGCVDQVGEQGLNVARSAALAAGLPDSVPATTVDRQCGSSQQAAHFAAQGVIAGAYDVVVAGGVESMSRVSLFANLPRRDEAFGPAFRARYGLGEHGWIDQGEAGEIVTDRWGLTREELDEVALHSHRRAAAAADAGRFDAEILPMRVTGEDGETRTITADEGIRRDTTPAALAGLRPVFREGGRLTAGSSAQISDGAAAMLITSRHTAARLGFTPIVRFRSFALAGVNPVEMLTGVIPATRRALDRAGLTVDDIDLFEVNEAFAPVPLVWRRELGVDAERVNVNGGAIALGHPLGATGARLMATLAHEMRRRGARFGLQTVCEGGGMANATVLELID